MSFKNKLLQLYATYNLNPTSLSRRLHYANAEKIARLTRDENNLPSYQILQDLIKEFKENIKAEWWFLDESLMLEEPREKYGFCRECLKKDGVIEHLKKECQAKQSRIEQLLIEGSQSPGETPGQTTTKKKVS